MNTDNGWFFCALANVERPEFLDADRADFAD
jgi:hypothetical protein